MGVKKKVQICIFPSWLPIDNTAEQEASRTDDKMNLSSRPQTSSNKIQ